LTITLEFALGGEKRKDERETGGSHLPTSTKNDDHLPQTLTPAPPSLLIFFSSLTSTLERKEKQYRESSRSRIIEKRRFHSQKKARSQMDCIEKAFEAKQSFALSFLLSLSLFSSSSFSGAREDRGERTTEDLELETSLEEEEEGERRAASARKTGAPRQLSSRRSTSIEVEGRMMTTTTLFARQVSPARQNRKSNASRWSY
jgi:hypothetical protein